MLLREPALPHDSSRVKEPHYNWIRFRGSAQYEYNNCREVNLNSWINAVWLHEDWHGTLGLAVAQQVNPRQSIEPLFARTESELRDAVRDQLVTARNLVGSAIKAADDPMQCPRYWYGSHFYRGASQWGQSFPYRVCYP